jgi:hypothetical protein
LLKKILQKIILPHFRGLTSTFCPQHTKNRGA